MFQNCFECVASQLYQSSALKTTATPSSANKPQIDSFRGKIRACLKRAQLAGPALSLCLLLRCPRWLGGAAVPAWQSQSILPRLPLPTGFNPSRNEEFSSLAGLLAEESRPAQVFRIPPAALGKQEWGWQHLLIPSTRKFSFHLGLLCQRRGKVKLSCWFAAWCSSALNASESHKLSGVSRPSSLTTEQKAIQPSPGEKE